MSFYFDIPSEAENNTPAAEPKTEITSHAGPLVLISQTEDNTPARPEKEITSKVPEDSNGTGTNEVSMMIQMANLVFVNLILRQFIV